MQYCFLTILYFLCIRSVLTNKTANNVCKTFNDYYKDLEHNPNCYYNPDVYLSVPQIIERYMYPLEIYNVVTEDGYILKIFRIPHGKNSSSKNIGPPVFLMHGLGVSSTMYVNIGNKSLAFILADRGYDVWLGNFRGTEYSDTHLSLNNTERLYWNFSFHELGTYDLPAQLNLVANVTQQKLFYIGFSMGTTSFYVYNTLYPEMAAQRIKLAISMAPIAFLDQTETPLKEFANPRTFEEIKEGLHFLTNGAIFQRTPESVANKIKNCLPYPIQMRKCKFAKFLLFGFDPLQEDPETFPITTIQDNDAMSVKNIEHFVQLVQTGRFQQFDYGEKSNKKKYGTSSPPEYDLSKMNVPNYLMRGPNDLVATKKNVEKLYSRLPPKVKPSQIYVIKHSMFSHMDFNEAVDVKTLVYYPVVRFLKTNWRY